MNLYTASEKRILRRLKTPALIQDFLNSLPYNSDIYVCMSPRRVLQKRKAYCLEGALLAAAALQFHGHKPLLLDVRAIDPDVDHVMALFQKDGYWGAITKTNYAVLRYREPIYKNIRELVLSFFHEYFLDNGKKTMRDYAGPINLNHKDFKGWQTADQDLWSLTKAIDKRPHKKILNKKQIKNLRKADPIERQAGKLRQWK